MNLLRTEQVFMSQAVVQAKGPTLLKATLGSCVGIALVWPSKSMFGLAHCLLPFDPAPVKVLGARYVDQAVESLLSLFAIDRQTLRFLEAHVAGGACMSHRQGPIAQGLNVGEMNGRAALDVLRALEIPIASIDLGGTQARQMVLDCTNGNIQVFSVPVPSKSGSVAIVGDVRDLPAISSADQNARA